VLGFAVLFCGGLAGSLFTPQPAGAVSRDMIELQQQVAQLLQGQQDLRSAVDTNSGALKTLVGQSLDSLTKMHAEIDAVQKVVQEVQANTGARIDSMTQQTQGISDNVQDIQSRVAKLSQQLNDVQGTLQSIDAKVSGGSVAPPAVAATPSANGSAPSAAPGPADSGAPGAPVSSAGADTLYQNALRDYTGGKYDLSQQEFSDYIQNFPANDLASNSQFYLGEIAYAQSDFKGAIAAYDVVLNSYPRSFKVAASLMKRGMAELELGLKANGIRDLREVVRKFPGSDEARRAQAKLREIGAPVVPRAPAR
jgi:tol-pal system protein YbgF